MKIAYVVSSLKVSMTFVVNELEAHEQAGWQVLPLVSCKPGPLENLSEVMVKWNKRAVFRPNVFVQSIVTLREIITHPLRFARVCFWLVTLLAHSPVEFAKALYELTTSCYFAGHCRRFSAEHIHVHFASRSLSLGLMMGMLTDLPISCTVHAFDIFTRSPGSLQTRLAKCKFIAAVSQFNVEYLRNTCGNSVADLCRVVHCGIDAEKFRSVSHQPEPGRIICVCRLSPKKGLDVAIRACAKLRDNNVKFLFEIAGDGPQRRALEELIVQLHLADNVKLLGARPNDQLTELFSRACVFLMPCVKTPGGDMDGIPVAMMEAMACEVPVVSTAISGIPELVEDGSTGHLAPEKNADALAQILKELLEDMNKIEQFGKAGRERVLKDFCISENAAKLRGLMLDARFSILDTRRESRIENRKSRMHILYIHQHFATPAGGTGTRSYEFARRWVKAGHKVTLIAGHYDIGGLQVSGALYQKQNIEGINVVVVGTKYSNKQSHLRRITSFLSFCLLSIYAGLRTKGVDVIYASSTPLTVGIPAVVIKWLKHIPFVFEVRDQWPEIPIELNIITNRILIKILLWLEKTIYRNCSSLIALSPGQADGIRKVLTPDSCNRGLTEEKPITVIPNSCDIDVFRPDIDGSAVRQKKGWENKLVLLHTGAMGKVNGLDFVIDAAEKLKDYSDIVFVLIGDGNQKPFLESRVKKLGLTNVEILPPVPKRELPEFYAAAEVGLVIIGNFPIIEHNCANKFFDSLSAGKPVLLNYSGWQRKILESNKAGFGCTLCNLDVFVQKVLYLNSHRPQVEQMGQNARQVATKEFNRDNLAKKALDVISSIAR